MIIHLYSMQFYFIYVRFISIQYMIEIKMANLICKGETIILLNRTVNKITVTPFQV